MAQKKTSRTPPPEAHAMPQSLRESAQHIWMAGLSAFAKAQSGGNKVFEALMKEGEAIQSRTRQAARDQVDDMAEKASGTWDKLEQVFETRVAKALHTLGVPTHEDIETLSRRVAELTAMVDGLQRSPAAPAASRQQAAIKKAAATSRPKAAAKKAPAASPKKAAVKEAPAPTAKKAPAPAAKKAPRRPTSKQSTARRAAD